MTELGAAGLRFERDGVIGWCIIDRPEARNAFTPAMYFGLKRAVHLVNKDPDLRAMIITGSGDVFSAGGDMGGRSGPGDEPVPDIGSDTLPFLTIRDSRAPVVAAVNGICQAGGLLVAMMADVCVASDQATFRVPELLRGLIDATYAAVLPAHVGIAVARDLLLTARRFDAAEAVRMGLITRVVPHDELRDAAVAAVGEILQTGPIARAHVKRMLNDRYGLIDYQTMFASLAESPEPREGMTAFMEKRAPNWVPAQFAKNAGSPRASPRRAVSADERAAVVQRSRSVANTETSSAKDVRLLEASHTGAVDLDNDTHNGRSRRQFAVTSAPRS